MQYPRTPDHGGMGASFAESAKRALGGGDGGGFGSGFGDRGLALTDPDPDPDPDSEPDPDPDPNPDPEPEPNPDPDLEPEPDPDTRYAAYCKNYECALATVGHCRRTSAGFVEFCERASEKTGMAPPTIAALCMRAALHRNPRSPPSAPHLLHSSSTALLSV